MSFPVGKWSFAAGEISPSLWGRPDFPKFRDGASVMRNCFVNYRGGTLSRAGTIFTGKCLQAGSSLPPRIMRFQFSTAQSYILEFGDRYLRFATNGGYVTETPLAITGATNANPCQLTIPGNAFVANDWIFVAGIAGMTALNDRFFIVSAVNPSSGAVSLTDIFGRQVNTTALAAYISGGTAARIYTIATPYAAADVAYLKVAQSSDVMSICCVNQDTGVEYPPYDLLRFSGNNWKLVQTSFGSSIQSPGSPSGLPVDTARVTSITDPANTTYTVALPSGIAAGDMLIVAIATNAAGPTIFPAGWTKLDQSGLQSIGYRIAGSAEPATMAVTGPNSKVAQIAWRVTNAAGIAPVTGVAATGTSAAPGPPSVSPPWGAVPTLYIAIADYPDTAQTVSAYPAGYLNAVLSQTSATGDATIAGASILDTVVTESPGAFALSGSETWLTQTIAIRGAEAGGVSAVAQNVAASNPTSYAYVVTAVDSVTGQESVASPVANVTNSVNIGTVLGSVVVTWASVPGAAFYNIYKAQASAYNALVPVGSQFGLVGQSYGTQWVDSNVLPDFSIVPPLHTNPFARGQVLSARKVGTGSGYQQATTTASFVSISASGVVLLPVVVNGDVVAIIVQNSGQNAQAGDTILITSTGGGVGATFVPVIGPQSGTYPSVVGYFQQRRVYAGTLNNPDTYFMSQTGAFTNMDAAVPPIDSDAIIGSPWAEQVNGIQWLQPMPGGLIIGTGLDAWQVSGTAGAGSPVTPSSQNAQPQESNGFSPTVPPIKVNYDILYLQSLGTVVRDLQYNFFVNIYAGSDISLASDHMFSNFQIKEWAWAKEPNKVIWAVRSDGKLLSLTYLKEQEILGWARHDTNGLVQSVATASEPPVDAVYVVVKRYIAGVGQWAYYLERMDNRQWDGPEDPWCVDAGLSLPQPAPNATLTASSSGGVSQLADGYVVTGGSNYSQNPAVVISDPTGQGSGAQVALTVTAGVITGLTLVNPGIRYGAYQVRVFDATGSGAVIAFKIVNTVQFATDAAVFGNVGDIIRVGGGIATITAVLSPTLVTASLTSTILSTVTDDPNNLPVPAGPGQWTMTTPVTTLTNLDHLEGMQVATLADGSVQPSQVVSGGRITLANPASSIKVGLPFTVQLQSMHAEMPGGITIQGKRKSIDGVTVRMKGSRGVAVGCNQPVASALDSQQEVPWSHMQEVKDRTNGILAGNAIPLFTGDRFIRVDDDWNTADDQAAPGMVAVQQLYPLPMNVLAFVFDIEAGDG